ncbi:tRNA lysidine(34) synthetase TilS [Pelagibacteraceae bacterium]|jgi:tRNA(Ile)-lysidine synthase|nr:tRNA lysidine(34) synthetase TilS [Pelagibacteraceae bacterium]
MSKKNSSVNLKNGFRDLKDLSSIFINFKNKLSKLRNKSYVVAVSGGPDSLALAALTKAYSYEKKSKFNYVLIDHNIRKNSAKEAKQVKSLLKKHQIFLNIFLNKKKIEKNVQSQARKVRYEILTSYCRRKKINTILTAHNLEDQVETFFIRLSRGSGLSGLSAMKPLSKLDNNIRLYRPLLDTKKKFLVKISKNIFGKYFKDPSNLNHKYLRAKIRNLRKPLEKSGIEYDQITRSINNLASSKSTLDEYSKKIFKEVIKRTSKEILIDTNKFENYNNEIKIRIINEAIKKLKKNYYNPRSKKVNNLIKNLKGKKIRKSTLNGCIFEKKKDFLRIKTEKS